VALIFLSSFWAAKRVLQLVIWHGTSICFYAFIYTVVFLICSCILSILLGFCCYFLQIWYWTYRDSQYYQHLLTLFAILYNSNTEGTNFWSLNVTFRVMSMYACHLWYYFIIKWVETHASWWGGGQPNYK
jgi:hypothetical protein